jgi:two-component sensor histidine kinase
MSIWDWLFNPAGLTPHGFCLTWAPGLIGLHAGSDAVIGLSYLSIPLAMSAFAIQRRDLEYGWVVYLFVAFIVACGATHLFSILTLWVPSYGVEGLVKLLTALLSVATAAILWPLLPKLVALPSPAELARLNRELSANVEQLDQTAALLRASEARGRAANAELERRVASQTAELRAANIQLTEALAQQEIVVQERTTALEQRDVLLREVYHRVKNNLQVIDGLLVMQAAQLTDPESRNALRGLRSRVHALGLVHHQLMNSANLKTFDIAPFLEELSGNILDGAATDGVRLDVRAMPLEVGLDFAIPLGLLVTELVTNALKHAFPDGTGTIDVSLRRGADGEVALIVSDNGIGMQAGAANAGHKPGIGSTIIDGLVAQLKGTMTMGSDHGTTTEIRIAAPVLS